MAEFENRVAVVTGASGGLGRALCDVLTKSGAKLVAFDRDEEALASMSLGDDAIVLAGDITSDDDIDELTRQVTERFGRVDLLIHNAGVTHFSRFAESGPDVTARVMAINFTGAVRLTYALLPLVTTARGTIVAVSSVAGFAPLYARTGYAASKHAMHGFFESLRGELKDDGVHVLMVCPSYIATQNAAGHANGADAGGVSRPGSATATAGKPLSAEFVAAKILAGARDRKRQLVIGRVAKLSWFVSRLLPSFFEKKMLENTIAELDD